MKIDRKPKEKPDTYAKAGVDIRREDLAIRGICSWVKKTFKYREGKVGQVLTDIGHFANLIDMGDYALTLCADGVGSKVLVAQELNKFDTIGIDVVAMNVNDAICVGATPIAMVDYLAMQNTDPELAREISIGMCEGAKQADIAIIGGETATLPDTIVGLNNRGFDLAATVLGVAKKEKIVTGERVIPGDVVLGFKSSGIHSNGLTLARKVLPKDMWSALLQPTRIYVHEVLNLLENYEIHGLVNITGGGITNLSRVTKYGFIVDKPPEPQMIFKKIQELGKISDKEMYRTFNMGIGFCVITNKENADNILEKHGKEYGMSEIGKVVEEPYVKVIKNGKETIFEYPI